jgi:hypothetical protein
MPLEKWIQQLAHEKEKNRKVEAPAPGTMTMKK